MSESRVLVIEDNADVGMMEADVLRSVGYEARWTSDATAIETLKTFHPDVVVLDLMMPRSDGVEIAETMRADEVLADVPIVVASGISTICEQVDRIRTSYMVVKPFDIEELVAEVRRAEREG